MASVFSNDGKLGKGTVAFDSLMQVSYLASNSLDLDEVLPKTLAGIADALPADCLAVMQDDGASLTLRATWCARDDYSTQWQVYRKEECARLACQEVTSYIEGADDTRTRDLIPYLVTSEPVQALLVPLMVDGLPMGRLDIVRSLELPRFTASEKRFAEACGKILSLTLRNGIEYARVAWLAEHDPLTGIGNRRRFDVALSRELTRAQRYGRPITLLLIDLDDFKEVNTHLGLSGGDEILRRTAHVLANGARQGVDIPCRIGGDEFALVLPEICEAAAHELVQRLLKEVTKATAPLWPMRFSYSVSTFPAITAEDLRRSADSRLLDAKTQKPPAGPNLKLVQ